MIIQYCTVVRSASLSDNKLEHAQLLQYIIMKCIRVKNNCPGYYQGIRVWEGAQSTAERLQCNWEPGPAKHSKHHAEVHGRGLPNAKTFSAAGISHIWRCHKMWGFSSTTFKSPSTPLLFESGQPCQMLKERHPVCYLLVMVITGPLSNTGKNWHVFFMYKHRLERKPF